jgi:hypothetical protein
MATVTLARLGAPAVLCAVLLAGVVGCSRSDPPATSPATAGPATTKPATTTPATTTPTTAGADVTFQLPKSLCEAVDDSALKDLFPIDGGKPIANASGLCATSRSSTAMAVSLSIDAELLPNAKAGKLYLDTARRLGGGKPTDLPGAGSGAFWIGDTKKVKLVSYQANLVLTITCEPVSSQHELPAGVPERLGRVAAGTFARLAP